MRSFKIDDNPISYGGDSRYFPISCEAFEDGFYPELSITQNYVLERMTFLAWHRRDCLIWANWGFLEKFMKRLRKAAIIENVKSLNPTLILPYRQTSRGWIHLVNPVLIVREMKRRNASGQPEIWYPRQELANYDLVLKSFVRPDVGPEAQPGLELTDDEFLNETYKRVTGRAQLHTVKPPVEH
jgi:hypothetical protein